MRRTLANKQTDTHTHTHTLHDKIQYRAARFVKNYYNYNNSVTHNYGYIYIYIYIS